MSEWVPVFAQAAGAKPPRRVPVWLARFVAGKDVSNFAVALRGASNEKAKRELGWQPAHPSWRSGFAESLARLARDRAGDRQEDRRREDQQDPGRHQRADLMM